MEINRRTMKSYYPFTVDEIGTQSYRMGIVAALRKWDYNLALNLARLSYTDLVEDTFSSGYSLAWGMDENDPLLKDPVLLCKNQPETPSQNGTDVSA